jgi:hypothetical protein
MDEPLARAWQEWERFCIEAEARIKESAASGLVPAPTENAALRAALSVLSAEQLAVFLDDPRLEETHSEPGTGSLAATRFAFLLCFLPPAAAPTLAHRYDDPCRSKSNLPPRAALGLFFTLRWKCFLVANLRRDGALIALQAHRLQLAHFVQRFGDEASKALLVTRDSPTLTRELTNIQKRFPRSKSVV